VAIVESGLNADRVVSSGSISMDDCGRALDAQKKLDGYDSGFAD
jgi:hypothetical protein